MQHTPGDSDKPRSVLESKFFYEKPAFVLHIKPLPASMTTAGWRCLMNYCVWVSAKTGKKLVPDVKENGEVTLPAHSGYKEIVYKSVVGSYCSRFVDKISASAHCVYEVLCAAHNTAECIYDIAPDRFDPTEGAALDQHQTAAAAERYVGGFHVPPDGWD